MASPPFNLDSTDPTDSSIVSQFPLNERSFRDNIASYINTEHDINTGFHQFQVGSTSTKTALSSPPTGMLFYDNTLNALQINLGTSSSPNWTSVTSITGIAAGGDLSGTFPNPTVAQLQGHAVSNTAPSTNQVLVWNGSSWTPGLGNAGYIQGTTVSSTAPTTGQSLAFDGTNWSPQGAQGISADGYVKLPGGLYLQWGTASFSSGGNTVTFPIAFPTACLMVQVSAPNGSSPTGSTVCGVLSSGINRSNFTGYSTSTINYNWFALGY